MERECVLFVSVCVCVFLGEKESVCREREGQSEDVIMYVCVRACVCARACVCVCVCVRVCVYVCVTERERGNVLTILSLRMRILWLLS